MIGGHAMKRSASRAFTLIELLVVLAILSLLFGLIFMSTRTQQQGAQVRQQAELLASTLRQARNMAMAERAVYAVVFNIENQPGSSGAVLNNRSGGHWYRILGPSRTLGTGWAGSESSDFQGFIPYADGAGNFPDLLHQIKEAWIGEPHVLPAGSVRFLALSETDEGPALRNDSLTKTSHSGRSPIYYHSGGETTYPRPWFGYFDEATGELWPWGGYDPSRPYSGFFYQGKDGPVSGCVNPADRTYDQPWNGNELFEDIDLNGDGDLDDYGEKEIDWEVMRKGEPRPLVNADWLDAGVAFLPDGSAHFFEWNRSRRYYNDSQVIIVGSARPRLRANGVRDMSKTPIDYDGSPTQHYGQSFDGHSYSEGGLSGSNKDIPEVAHFERHLGGWHITLAPDVHADQTQFASAEDALDSITPAYRVFVGSGGSVDVLRVRRSEGALAGRTMWPQDPNDWLDQTKVWANCRLGELHQVDTSSDARDLVPRGRPVTDLVNTRMLTQRQWWIDE